MSYLGEFDIVERAAQLLRELGAEVRDNPFVLTIAFSDCGTDYGLQFVKRLFSPRLVAEGGKIVKLYNPEFLCRVRVLPFQQEADLERGEFPREFWDALWRMSRRLRRVIFNDRTADMRLTWLLLGQATKEHKENPSRETLLLKRLLWNFAEDEIAQRRLKAKKRNAMLQPAYEELLRLTNKTPHSLNVLRSSPGFSVRKMAESYWMVKVFVEGQEFLAYGVDPVHAAGNLIAKASGAKPGLTPALT